ncbi:MAG: hypothetical protein PHD83_06200 [Caldisericia bacterium]|nr:hypothetical protein [Caldisericia bacterium]
MIWKKITNYFKRVKNFFKTIIFSGFSESLQAKQAREFELDKLRRDSAIMFEKISRRI